MTDEEEVLDLNARFYKAFNDKDAEAMDSLWAHVAGRVHSSGVERAPRSRPRARELARDPW
jgi:hypothetical protein